MSSTWVLMVLTLFWETGFAKSFGVVGEVFPVAEKSLLRLIEERLAVLKASGALEAVNQRWIQTAALHANRPSPLGLGRTNRSARHYYTPEIVLRQDIADSRGHVLYASGTHANALSRMPSYKPCWLFFNAEDKAQLKWAELQKTGCPNPKFILTGGAVHAAEQRLQSVIYFDQAGKITRQLKITHVPTLVLRRGNQLEIWEHAIKESGHVL